MAKGTKVTARFSDGQVLTRTTTKNLTHAWAFKADRGENNICGDSGFASSHQLAARALTSAINFATKPSRWNKHNNGSVTFSEIVEVERAA